MKKFLNEIINQIFPIFYMRKVNKQLKNKIESNESQSNVPYMDNIDKITIDSFRQKYAETFEIKSKFEDKAKTNVIGITIAITIIMGASNLTGLLTNKYTSPFWHWLSFIILLVAIIYLLTSGIAAIRVLFSENTVSTVDLSDLSTDDIKTKKKYDDCTNRNIKRNIIRNNIVYSSYICIRNALICLMALFILVSIPITSPKIQNSDYNSILRNASIAYSSTIFIPDEIDTSKINDSIIQDKMKRKSIDDGMIYSFVNVTEKFFVQYKCFGSEIIVVNFACFDNMQHK